MKRGKRMFKIIKKILGIDNEDKKNIELIRNSQYFDAKYYLKENPEVKGDPCEHYYYKGWKEGKSPSFYFSNDFYLKNYKDVEDAGLNPLLHYLKFGKRENRLIEMDNGLSLKKIYSKIYNCSYFYKTYINDSNIKRINLFFDELKENVTELVDLIKFINDFCNQYDYQLRIIYYTANFQTLKQTLKNNNITFNSNVTFLNLKSSNYLEVGLNEKYICTSWKNARALLNTSSINQQIYFYLNNLDNLSQEEYYQISNVCTNPHVTCLIKDETLFKKLKKCRLVFETNHQPITNKSPKQLYCDFDKMFIVGVELLNETFLTGTLNSSEWKVNIVNYENDFNFHFDTNVIINKIKKINPQEPKEKLNLVFQMSYTKPEVTYSVPTITAWVKEEPYKNFNYLNILDKASLSKLNQEEKITITQIDNYYQKFSNSLLELTKEDQNV